MNREWFVCTMLLGLLAGTGLAQEPPTEKKLTLHFVETPLADVLSFLSDAAGMNYACSAKVLKDAPPVTAKMKDVPVSEVISSIARACGLEYEVGKTGVVAFFPRREPPSGQPEPGKPIAKRGDKPLFVDDFETSLGGWFAPRAKLGDILIEGHAERTDKPEDVKEGKGALAWDYNYGPGMVSAVMKTRRLDPEAKSLAFWLKSRNAPITLVVKVKERDESGYDHVIQVNVPDQWQEFTLPFADFNLDNDSQDENGRLDVDQVKEIVFFDATGILTQADGRNSVFLDSVMVR